MSDACAHRSLLRTSPTGITPFEWKCDSCALRVTQLAAPDAALVALAEDSERLDWLERHWFKLTAPLTGEGAEFSIRTENATYSGMTSARAAIDAARGAPAPEPRCIYCRDTGITMGGISCSVCSGQRPSSEAK